MGREEKKITIAVPAEIELTRLDKFLASQDDLDLSRSFVQHIIGEGLVLVNGKPAAKNVRLKGGETIALIIPPKEMLDLTPEDIPLDIRYDDDYLAVINKPAGLVVHPAPGNPQHTLVNALLYHFGTLADDPEGFRPGIIHRLDKNTSGLLLIAKDDSTARRLREQLANREIVKIYMAVICGHMADESGTINLPIGRSIRDRKKMIVTNVKSREAITHYKVIERFRLCDLVEIRLETGRTHQIRVHFSHRNHPVLGDPDYGGRLRWLRGIDPTERTTGQALLKMIQRQALHAAGLTFTHPSTGEEISVTCEIPEDMQALIDALHSGNR